LASRDGIAQATGLWTVDWYWDRVVRVCEGAETEVAPRCTRSRVDIASAARLSSYLVVAVSTVEVGRTCAVVTATRGRLVDAGSSVHAWSVGTCG